MKTNKKKIKKNRSVINPEKLILDKLITLLNNVGTSILN